VVKPQFNALKGVDLDHVSESPPRLFRAVAISRVAAACLRRDLVLRQSEGGFKATKLS